jgi:hypothetical protein
MSNRTWQQELSLLREDWTQARAAAQAAVAAQAPAIEHLFASTVHPAFAAVESELAPYREVVLSGLYQTLNYDFGKIWESSILSSARRHPSDEALALPGPGDERSEDGPDPLSGVAEQPGSKRRLGRGLDALIPDDLADRDEMCYTFYIRLVPHRVIHYTQFRCADFRNGDIVSTRGQVRAVTTLADLLLITQDDVIQHFLMEWRQRLPE